MYVLVIIRSRRSGDAWLPSSMEVTGVAGPAYGRRPGKEAETGYDHLPAREECACASGGRADRMVDLTPPGAGSHVAELLGPTGTAPASDGGRDDPTIRLRGRLGQAMMRPSAVARRPRDVAEDLGNLGKPGPHWHRRLGSPSI